MKTKPLTWIANRIALFALLAGVAFSALAESTLRIDFDNEAIQPTPAQNAAIRRAAAADIKEFNHPQQNDWRVNQADLNDDGRPDLLVQYTYDSSFCGSRGCSGVIVMATPTGYATKSTSLPNFMGEMNILDAKHHGMHDLRFDDAHYVFKWNGKAYQ